MIKVSAIVMASGKSKRMTADKLHLMLGHKYLYEYILDTIKQYSFFEVMVAAKDDDILRKAEALGFVGVRNEKHHLGQSESIKAALEASHKTDGYMFFAADQPFISLKTIDELVGSFKKDPSAIVMPFYHGKKGSPVIFPYDLKDELMSLEGDVGGKAVIAQNRNRVTRIDIAADLDAIDIDTPEDYERVKHIFVHSGIE